MMSAGKEKQNTTDEQAKSEDFDEQRRRFLVASTSVIGGVGALCAVTPLVSSWMPSAKAEAAGAPVQVDLSRLEPGQQVTVEWRGKPVWIIRRTTDMLKHLTGHDEALRDPNSLVEQQPSYAKNNVRSIKPEYLVLIGICTHLGCVPTGQKSTEERGEYDGWFCPCHGSQYDTSGRIRKGPAPKNLPVPPYEFISDTVIKIG